MQQRRYGRGPNVFHVSDWRQQNVEMAVKREAKEPSFTPGPRYMVIEMYMNNKDKYGEKKAIEMAHKKAIEISSVYTPEIVDMWIKEYEEKGFKADIEKIQGDDDDAR